MRNLIFILLLFLSTKCLAQPPGREGRFADSLTLNTHRTWYRTDGVRFTKVKDNCSYGMEMIFYKEGSKAIMRKCEQGAWVENEYQFRVTGKDANHYVEIVDNNNSIVSTLEIQMLGSDNKFKTELTYYNINSKEFYTLITDEY